MSRYLWTLGERQLVAGSLNASGRKAFIQYLCSIQTKHSAQPQPSKQDSRLTAERTTQPLANKNEGEKELSVESSCIEAPSLEVLNIENPSLKNISLESLSLVKQKNNQPSGNLLNGDYKQKPKETNQLLYIAAGIVGLGLMLNLAVGFMQHTELKETQQQLVQETAQAFKNALPNARMVDPEFQLKQAHQQRSLAVKAPEVLNVLNLFSGQLGERYQRPLELITYSKSDKKVSIVYSGSAIEKTESAIGDNGEKYSIQMRSKQGDRHHVDVIW